MSPHDVPSTCGPVAPPLSSAVPLPRLWLTQLQAEFASSCGGVAALTGSRSWRAVGALKPLSRRALARRVHSSAAISSSEPAPGASTTTATDTPSGVKTVQPTGVFVKVAAPGTGRYLRFRSVDWDTLARMEADQLLVALAASTLFGVALKDVDLAACRVFVVNAHKLTVDNMATPDTLRESGDSAVELGAEETVGDLAAAVGVHGAPLFIRVQVQGER